MGKIFDTVCELSSPNVGFYQDDDQILWESANLQAAADHYKETVGKPSGARYCYLADIAAVLSPNDQLLNLGKALDVIVDDVDRNANFSAISIRIASEYLFLIENKQDILNDLITLRTQVLANGKYTKNGYKEPLEPSLLLDAIGRHYIKYCAGYKIDEESDKSHLAHILANLIMLSYQLRSTECIKPF